MALGRGCPEWSSSANSMIDEYRGLKRVTFRRDDLELCRLHDQAGAAEGGRQQEGSLHAGKVDSYHDNGDPANGVPVDH